MSAPIPPPDEDTQPIPRVPPTPWYFSQNSATLATIAATLISVVALIIGAVAYLLPRSPGRSASVTITSLDVNSEGRVDVSLEGPGLDPGQTFDAAASTVTILVENRGELPALITSVQADVTRVEQFFPCTDQGGEVSTTGNYDVSIPSDVVPPSRQATSSKFQIAPESFDQLELTVGSESLGDGEFPYLYELRVVLVLSTGEEIISDKVALSGPLIDAQSMIEIGRQDSSDPAKSTCIAGNRALLDDISSDVAVVAPELRALRAGYPT